MSERAGLDDILPLSPLQEGLLYHRLSESDTGPDVYAVQMVVDLAGPLDAARLRDAVAALLRRHSSLRAGFRHEGVSRPVQVIPRTVRTPWQEVDVTGLAAEDRDAAAHRVVQDDRTLRFDLARPPLVRFTLIRLAAGRHRFLITNHHILLDGWSVPILLRELVALYHSGGDDRELPPVRPYRDYLTWLAGQDRAAAIEAWRWHFAGLDGPCLVAPGVPAGPMTPERVSFGLSPQRTAALTARARALGVTVNTLIQGAWAVLLSRLTGEYDLIFGIAVSGRPAELVGVDTMVGLFINTVPLRLRLRSAEPLGEMLARLQREQADLLTRQHLSLAEIQRLAGHTPLFDTLAVFENYPGGSDGDESAAEADPTELRVLRTSSRDATHYPLALLAAPGPRLKLRLDYRPDWYTGPEAAELADRLIRVLDAIVDEPELPVGRVDTLSPDQHRRLLAAVGPRPGPVPHSSVPDLFAAQAGRGPESVALTAGDDAVTYRQLDGRANRLAHQLRRAGVRTETTVLLLLPRTPDLVVAILAVLKAGGAYVPLNESFPSERRRYIAGQAGATIVLADRSTAGDAAGLGVPIVLVDDPDLAGTDDRGPEVRIRPEQLAYVMYTSGTTGEPKGVAVTHRDICQLAADHRFASGAHERVLMHSPHSFDASTYELWVPLLRGNQVVLAPPGELTVPVLERELAERSVTAVWLTAGLFQVVAEEAPAALAGVREVWAGGDVLSAAAVRRVAEHCPDTVVVDGYGPTETTTFALSHRVPAGGPVSASIPIGRPLDNMRAYVLDGGLLPVPKSAVGELYLAGTGVARGYHDRPALTAERFLADPYGPPGERMYRTGDLARRGTDGNIEFLGRRDGQVKVRGFRIELGEIEAVLVDTRLDDGSAVASCVAVVREDRPGDRRLVAYVVGTGPELDLPALRAAAARRLPDHMLPELVALPALPLTPNGKVDRRALPAPSRTAGAGARDARGPREELLRGLFAELLNVPAVGVDDDFFALGGHSLLVTRLVSRVRSLLAVELSVRQVFDHPTVAALAAALDAADRGTRPPVAAVVDRPERLPLSFAQRRLWFLHRLDGPSPTYHIPSALRLRGRVDRAALGAALTDVLTRHESLRTVFAEDAAGPYQSVLSVEAAAVDLPVQPAVAEDLDALLTAAAREPFDLTAGPLLRARLFDLGGDEHVLLLVLHHIAGDGWSMPVLARDLAEAYAARSAGAAPARPPLPVQYGDYTLWQRAVLGSEDEPDTVIAAQLRYWRAVLAGLPEQLELPVDRPRPPVPTHSGGRVEFELPATLHRQLRDLARRSRVTPFMLVQAGVAALLSRLGAGDDIPLGTPIAGRTDDALTDLVGFFANTLVLRTDVSGDPTFAELLRRVRKNGLAAYAHQDVPFERLVEVLNPPRSMARHPLFQVMLTMNNIGGPAGTAAPIDGVSLEGVPVGLNAAKFDLLFAFAGGESDAALHGSIEYSSDVFDEATVRDLADRLLRLLDAAIVAPDQPLSRLDLFAPGERDRILAVGTGVTRPVPAGGIAELFRRQVTRTPDLAAVVAGGTVIDYAELDQRSNRLSRLLIRRGVRAERTVAVLLPRTEQIVVATLAVFKAGAAYLPIDPSHPAERIDTLLADAQPALVLTTTELAGLFTENAPTLVLDHPDTIAEDSGRPEEPAEPAVPVHPAHPAYVIYTSGSTGRPKGVVMPVGGLVNLLQWHRTAVPGRTGARVAQFTSVGFDVSVQEILATVLHGKTLVVCPEEVRRDPDRLRDWLDGSGVEELYAPNLVVDAVAEAA
ncbi:amino acid adenylation domain-containing protein, partial [Micromonospora sp. NPDC051296]|uniref:amino acid adenylation domain-containing protein n=1 Tax=Micromonospora sp. NPDC051296 TaxID=3155046 RepID=UPI0034304A90